MLQVLPASISNLIAAGEVVTRPASVVKELIENAVDAGADTISVIIEDAGRTSIQIIDNGSGMTPEEAVLCFERHATSKVAKADDLNSIQTYGFRGEALPSIAAVAEVTLKSRKRGTDTGSEVTIAGSEFISQEEVACAEGTNISVRNLFYKIPARRKFLKSDNAEFRHIITEFIRVALCRYDLNLRLIHNGKDIYNLKRANSIKQRIMEIEGREIIKELVDIGINSSIVTVSGFIGHPEDARKSSGNQYFFVNGRFFKSPYFHKAIMRGYDKLIPEGTYPSYYLFFETNPENVDVNIHPAKTEVKFENESEMFEILTALVKESLGKNSFIPTIDFNNDSYPQINIPKDYTPILPTLKSSPSYSIPKLTHLPGFDKNFGSDFPEEFPRDFEQEFGQGFGQNFEQNFEQESTGTDYNISSMVDGYGGEIFDSKDSLDDNTLVLSSKYIITALRSGMLIINIFRAKERIFYEKFLHNLDNSESIAQQVLFPSTLELTPAHYSLLMDSPERLQSLGFDITSAGENTISVNGLPEGFNTDSAAVREIIDSLIATFEQCESNWLTKAQGRDNMARSLARATALGGQKRLSRAQARALVDSLFCCAEPEISPSGKKIMEMITEEDLEKRL